MECTRKNSSRGRYLVLVCATSALFRNLPLYCCCNLLGDFILVQKVDLLLCRVDIHVEILRIDCDAAQTLVSGNWERKGTAGAPQIDKRGRPFGQDRGIHRLNRPLDAL